MTMKVSYLSLDCFQNKTTNPLLSVYDLRYGAVSADGHRTKRGHFLPPMCSHQVGSSGFQFCSRSFRLREISMFSSRLREREVSAKYFFMFGDVIYSRTATRPAPVYEKCTPNGEMKANRHTRPNTTSVNPFTPSFFLSKTKPLYIAFPIRMSGIAGKHLTNNATVM